MAFSVTWNNWQRRTSCHMPVLVQSLAPFTWVSKASSIIQPSDTLSLNKSKLWALHSASLTCAIHVSALRTATLFCKPETHKTQRVHSASTERLNVLTVLRCVAMFVIICWDSARINTICKQRASWSGLFGCPIGQSPITELDGYHVPKTPCN